MLSFPMTRQLISALIVVFVSVMGAQAQSGDVAKVLMELENAWVVVVYVCFCVLTRTESFNPVTLLPSTTQSIHLRLRAEFDRFWRGDSASTSSSFNAGRQRS